jgi:hypothetical protein
MPKSLAYQQAGMESRQRMESLFNMGLPMQSDVNRLRYEGSNYYTRSPIYSAAPHQPWGTWGAVGGQIAEDGKPVTPVTTGKFDTSKSSTPSSAARGASIGEKEKARTLKRVANDPRRQFGWTGSSPLASNEERDARRALDISMPRQLSSQERANVNEVDAREARRQRIRNATQDATIFPYLRSELGESRNSPSIFNYPTYGPSPL